MNLATESVLKIHTLFFRVFTDSDEDSESEVSSTNSTPVMVSLNGKTRLFVTDQDVNARIRKLLASVLI